jgi:hypothetical protein
MQDPHIASAMNNLAEFYPSTLDPPTLDPCAVEPPILKAKPWG